MQFMERHTLQSRLQTKLTQLLLAKTMIEQALLLEGCPVDLCYAPKEKRTSYIANRILTGLVADGRESVASSRSVWSSIGLNLQRL